MFHAKAVPELAPPVSHSGDQPFYANARVIVPILVSVLILCGLVTAVLLIRRKSKYNFKYILVIFIKY